MIIDAVIDHKTDTGKMRISSPELTALDLLRYAHAAGGIDSIATVLSDLGDKIKPERLSAVAPSFERTVLQRLGYLLDHLKFHAQAESLQPHLLQSKPLPWVELEPSRNRDPDLTDAPIERNARWHVIVRHLPEIDE
jgi:AbiEi antitoxin C-terminal domain